MRRTPPRSLRRVRARADVRGPQPGPIEEKSAEPQIAQTAIPNGKYYLMKMIRRQVAMKQRQAKEKAEGVRPLKVHIMRSYKQVGSGFRIRF